MNLKPVRIEFSVEEINDLLRISMDDDRDQALEFVKSVLVKRIEKALQRH